MDNKNISCKDCIYYDSPKDDSPKCNKFNYYVYIYDSCIYAKKKKK